jgi:hypothetical protein
MSLFRFMYTLWIVLMVLSASVFPKIAAAPVPVTRMIAEQRPRIQVWFAWMWERRHPGHRWMA